MIVEAAIRTLNAVRRSCLRAPRSALLTLAALALLLYLLNSSPSARPRSLWVDDDEGDGELIPTEETHRDEWDGVVPDWPSLLPPSSPPPGSLPKDASHWPRLATPLTSSAPVEEPFPEALRAKLYPASGPAPYTPLKEVFDATRRRSTYARDWVAPVGGMGDGWRERRPKRVQHDFGAWEDSEVEQDRREAVRNAFIWAWEAYKRNAWGHDEVKPVSAMPSDPFNGWGATIIDSLDTLLLLDLPAEFSLAREHVRQVSFGIVGGASWVDGLVFNSDASSRDTRHPQLGVFETTIRYLGGLLGGYELSGDRLLLERAEELAVIMLPAFDTPTGLPYATITPGRPHVFGTEYQVSLAEAGSMTLEMTRLSQLTGNQTYFDRVQRVTDYLDEKLSKRSLYPPLFPTTFDPDPTGDLDGVYSYGGQADSYYEYLIKQVQLLGGTGAKAAQYARMYEQALDRAYQTMIRDINVVPGQSLITFGEISFGRFMPRLEHLTCFVGAMMGLGSRLLDRPQDLSTAERLTQTCYYMGAATESGLQAEKITFFGERDLDRFVHVKDSNRQPMYQRPAGRPMGVRETEGKYINRPETIESVFYMYRLTGDKLWQDKGWRMFSAWMDNALVDDGFASVSDVRRKAGTKIDNMESFALAETFKYHFLLHADPSLLSLDDYVLNTEAHPLLVNPVIQPGSQGLWSPSVAPAYPLPADSASHPSGQGTSAQLWSIYNRLPAAPGSAAADDGKRPTRPLGGIDIPPQAAGGGGRGMGGGAAWMKKPVGGPAKGPSAEDRPKPGLP